MQLAFIDDSEEKQPRRAGLGHLVAVGGVVVPETAVAPYSIGLPAASAAATAARPARATGGPPPRWRRVPWLQSSSGWRFR
jgi:hypothetical protein